MSPPVVHVRLKPLSQILEFLYATKTFTDFTIHFKNTPILVHKCVLGPRWDYFSGIILKGETVLSSPMPILTFNKLIEYFYTGNVSMLTLKDCGWILSLAEFYLLQDEQNLVQYCDQMVNSQINSTNLLEALQLAMDLDNEQLKKKAISWNLQETLLCCLGFVEDQKKKNSRTTKYHSTTFSTTVLHQTTTRPCSRTK